MSYVVKLVLDSLLYVFFALVAGVIVFFILHDEDFSKIGLGDSIGLAIAGFVVNGFYHGYKYVANDLGLTDRV